MKYLSTLLTLILSLLIAISVSAQETETEFELHEDTTFGVAWMRPSEWENVAMGVFARPPAASSMTTIIVQSAPLDNQTLQGALTAQLGIEAFPEPAGEVITDFATWTEYHIQLEDFGLSISVALSEIEGVSYLVLLQSPTAEHEVLRDDIYTTVINSVAVIEDETELTEESDAPYNEEEVSFSNGDATLAGTLTLPNDVENPPVLVIVSGSGLQDRTGAIPTIAAIEPYTQMADYLASNGIAVLRYDDRGAGESTGEVQTADLNDFRDDANAAVDFLADREQFSHIGIAGHSEGGVYAPEIALTNENVDFIIGLAAPTVSLIDVTCYQQGVFFQQAGYSDEQLAALDDAYAAVIDAVNLDDADALLEAVRNLVALQTGREPSESEIELGMAQFQLAIVRTYIDYVPTQFWLDLDVPTLAIFGELDTQVVPAQNIPPIEDVNENITIVTIPSMNHIFQEAETGSPLEYGTLEQAVMPAFLETLTEWILETTSQ